VAEIILLGKRIKRVAIFCHDIQIFWKKSEYTFCDLFVMSSIVKYCAIKGIASRIMARMGYIVGQGLGKNSEGRAEPVPIQLLPQGKILNVCSSFLFY